MVFKIKAPPGPAPIRWLTGLVDLAILFVGTCMVGLVSANVLIHVVKFDIAFTTELCEFMMTWVTFLGGAAAARRGIHMTITEFVDKLPAKGRFWADGAIQVFCSAVLLVCVLYGSRIAKLTWGNEMTVLHWPLGVQYMALPVGSAFALVFILSDLYQIIRGVPREIRYGGGE
jgi:TRAP-type transport system small permease protein